LINDTKRIRHKFYQLWNLLYIQSLLHYIENAQENKKNTIVSYNITENSKRIKRNEDQGHHIVTKVSHGFGQIDIRLNPHEPAGQMR